MSHLVGRVVEPDEVVLAGMNNALVRLALSKLTPRYQKALSLRYLSGLTNEEVADAFGVSRSTMAVIVHRALKSLRKHIDVAEVDLRSREAS